MLLVALVAAGFTPAIYFRLPFFVERPDRQRWFIAAGFALPTALAMSLGLYILVLVSVTQLFSSPDRTRFAASDGSGDEVWFIEEGFMDRDISLYAKPKSQAAQFVAYTFWDTDEPDRFAYGRWSADGRVFACYLTFKQTPKAPPLLAFAYDFSANQVVGPPLRTDTFTADEVKEFAPALDQLVAAHGGLRGPTIDVAALQKNATPIWIWQMPERP